MSPRKNCVVSPAELRPRHQSHCPHCRLRDASSWGHKVSSSPHHHNRPPPAELLRADQHIVRGPAVNVHDEAHAARVPLQRGVVQTWGKIVVRSWVVTAGLWWGNDPGGANLSILSSHSRADADTSSYNFTSSWLPRGFSDNVGMRAVAHHHHRSLALQI